MNTTDDQPPVPSNGAFPLGSASPAEDTEQLAAAAGGDADRPKVSGAFITLLALGLFGTYLAFVTPIAISLAIRVNALAPDHAEYLGVVLGFGSLAALLTSPLAGQLSDRTRSRWGRRRPWLVGGILAGILGLAVMAASPAVLGLGIGWVIAQIGLNSTVNTFGTIQADKLPENQRGKVGAITGFATMVAPVFGAVFGGTVANQPFLLFLAPAFVALVVVLVFVVYYKDADSRNLTFDSPLTAKVLVSKYVFNPKRYPDFAWNWLGRFLFFFGLTLNTSYTAFFFAERLDIPVDQIGGTVATVGGIGILGTVAGVFLGGFLSDKLRRRKAFVLGSGILFGIGALVMVVAPDLTLLLVGSLLCNISIGVFSAVDQALYLDVLPERDTEAGRFVNIIQLANVLAQAIAPFVAAAALALITTGDRYAVIYIAAAVFTVAGGLVILKVKAVR
ncbi:MFS transporter [Leifsonia sp. Leaf264]|uniref:MFS transporter n=1 Tax=Leifsonia sp. Leaf264 TaxID=1736314 RepID=UPI0006FD094E|nr:MFS transporter [Leifsonia sp. Leaf264]KQO97572.1 MFS transporter [Leifsonia sp. Leaf264]